MMSAVRAASSLGVVGILRCVDRCCPKARHARLSEMPSGCHMIHACLLATFTSRTILPVSSNTDAGLLDRYT